MSISRKRAIIRARPELAATLYKRGWLMLRQFWKEPGAWRWWLGLTMAVALVALPYYYYRWSYETSRRLREVVAGKVYRSGCMTAEGLRRAVQQHGIRTVINLMEEAPDPELRKTYFDRQTEKESAVCRELGVDFVFLPVEVLEPSREASERPAGIDRFLQLMDKASSYPILLHCKAGLHRTGILTAIYRMEYQGWTREQAWLELRANGFGEFNCYSDNDYIRQYVMSYRPGLRYPLAAGSAALGQRLPR